MSTPAEKLESAIDYRQPEPWYRGDNAGNHPLTWTETGGVRHPRRACLPGGELYRRHIEALDMDFSIRRLDPALDLQRLTHWMNDPRIAEFWEQAWSEDKQAEYIDKTLADPHKQPVIASFGDTPFAYFEIYWALEDRLGPYYDADPFDRGLHLLVGETGFLGTRYFNRWIVSVCHFMFLDDSRTQRLVGEPRADNAALLKHLAGANGWRKIKEFDFPHKRAALVTCRREDFFNEASFA